MPPNATGTTAHLELQGAFNGQYTITNTNGQHALLMPTSYKRVDTNTIVQIDMRDIAGTSA